MAQPFLKVDGIQIEPGETGTRSVDRDSSGNLRLIDPSNTSGLTLSQLAGIRNITGIYVVGRAGSGVAYTTIQAALNAIPTTSSETAPSIVLVGPGVYTENLSITKNGVIIVGEGLVVLAPSAVDATITIQDGTTTEPQYVVLRNLRITQSNDNEECIKINGGASSNVGLTGIFIEDCQLVASGVGCYTIRADTINEIYVRRGSWEGSASTSICDITQCALFDMEHVEEAIANFGLVYNTANPRPTTVTCTYKLSDCRSVQDITSSLTGAGTVFLFDVGCANLSQSGNKALRLKGVDVGGNLTLNGTTAASMRSTLVSGSLLGAGTLNADFMSGSQAFVGSASEAVSFSVLRSDANYAVFLDYDTSAVAAGHPAVTIRAVGGFTITLPAVYTGTIRFLVMDTALVQPK